MKKILYGDHFRPAIFLVNTLKFAGIVSPIDVIQGPDALKHFIEGGFEEKGDEYRVIIAHLGVEFIPIAQRMLEQNNNLKLAVVSEFPSHYKEMDDQNRVIVTSYDSENLIRFLRERQ